MLAVKSLHQERYWVACIGNRVIVYDVVSTYYDGRYDI